MAQPASLRSHAWIAGLAFLILFLALALKDPRPALLGWLAAFSFWSSLPLGALFLVMMMRLIPGVWRAWLANPAHAVLLMLPMTLLLALPVMAGVDVIYPWAHGVDGTFRAVYLSTWFFALRSLAILAGASLLGWMLLFWRKAGVAVATVGLIVFVLLHGLLATDWVESLDPEFHSASFGLYFLSCQALVALCLLILFSPDHTAAPLVPAALLLTGILLWAYLAFLPYVILWSGNLPPGAGWYGRRGQGAWAICEYAIAVLHLVPAFLLLFPPVRRSCSALGVLATAVLVGKVVEMAWLVLPELKGDQLLGVAAYVSALAGLSLVTASLLPLMERCWPIAFSGGKEISS